MNKISEMEAVLEKYFRDHKTLYFDSSNSHKGLCQGDTCLRYEYLLGDKDSVIIWFTGGQFDEVPLRVCHTANEIEEIIKAMIQ